MARAAAHSDSEESSKAKTQAEEENGAEDEEVEYEIEEVLDAKRGVFPDGHIGYFVKWKGYGAEENSWVDENDAENARELVDEFWRKNPQKKKISGKAADKKTPEKGRKSQAADDSDAVESKSKKRGRKSVTQKGESGSDAEMEVDQQAVPAAKKAKKNQANKKRRTETPEVEDKPLGNMSRYMTIQDWEGLVARVDTVERTSEDSLTVYFTLNTGEVVKENNTVCNKRFPHKMLQFYESNLRWRSLEEGP